MSVQVRSLSHRRRIAAAPWTPASATAGGYLPAHWYRSDQGLWQDAGTTPATSDGVAVGRWEDLTANADHINQATAAKKPTLQNAAADLLNGHPILRFDGTDDYLLGAFTNGGQMTQPNTVFVVAMLNAASVNDDATVVVVGGDDATHRASIYKTGGTTPDTFAINSGANLTGLAADADWHIRTVLFSGAASRFWRNGVAECAAGDAGAENQDGLTIGAYSSPPAGMSLFWPGEVAEVLLYDANLPNADSNQVGRYLAARYGLAYTDI